MSPARTSDGGLDYNALVRRIVLDIALLQYLATSGRSLAVISAIAVARREGSVADVPVLDFLERHVSPTQ